jgi:type I restriction enzyme S subunit
MKSFLLPELIDDLQSGIACGERNNSGVIQLRMNNVLTNGEMDFRNHIRIPKHYLNEGMLLREGDVLFNNTNSVELVGKTALFRGFHEAVTFSNHFFRIRTKRNLLSPEYLAYRFQYLWSSGYFESICDRWVGQSAVQRRKLDLIEIPLPNIHIQNQIAAKLKSQLAEVEIARQALQQQESDLEKIQMRIFASVFSNLNANIMTKIGDFAETTSGSTPSRDKKDYWQPAEIAWVKTGEVANHRISETEESISKKALAECSLTLLPPKSVLIAMYGQGKTRGQSAVLEIPATTNQACFAILPNDSFHSEYLQYWLRYSYSDLRALSDGRGGNQANLNGAMLKEFMVPLIAKSEQIAIAGKIDKMLGEYDVAKSAIQSAKKEIGLLPSRLLEQAFNFDNPE